MCFNVQVILNNMCAVLSVIHDTKCLLRKQKVMALMHFWFKRKPHCCTPLSPGFQTWQNSPDLFLRVVFYSKSQKYKHTLLSPIFHSMKFYFPEIAIVDSLFCIMSFKAFCFHKYMYAYVYAPYTQILYVIIGIALLLFEYNVHKLYMHIYVFLTRT